MDAEWLVRGASLLAAGCLLDRLLLWCESRGWLNYRRNGLSRGAALYHTLELHSIFDPGILQVIEIEYQERKEQDGSGAPPAPPEDPPIP